MTKRGFGFLLLFALELLAALATGFSEIFLIAILSGMVLAFAAVSVAAGVFVLHALHSVAPASVVRGEKAHIEMQFEGTLLLPVIVKIKLLLPEGKSYKCADMLFGSLHALTYDDFNCPHRGLWQIGIEKVMCSDIFGFFSISLRRCNMPSQKTSLLVYPILRELAGSPRPPVPSIDYSENNPVTADQGDSFSDTRLYRDGDPLKRIHWKMTIRTREMYTRQYEMSIDKMVLIILDNAVLSGIPASSSLGYADMAAECCAALILFFLSSGHTIKLVPTGAADKSVLIRTQDEFEEVYTLLASLPFTSAVSLSQVISDQIIDPSRITALQVIAHQPSADVIHLLSEFSEPQRKAALIYPFMTNSAYCHDEPQITPEGLHIIPILQPRDIAERLGGII